MSSVFKVTLLIFSFIFSVLVQASDSDVRYIKALKHDRFSDQYFLTLQGLEADSTFSHCSGFMLDGGYDVMLVIKLKKALKESRQVIVSYDPPADGSMIVVGDGCSLTDVRLI
jgi:hypothetical protein